MGPWPLIALGILAIVGFKKGWWGSHRAATRGTRPRRLPRRPPPRLLPHRRARRRPPRRARRRPHLPRTRRGSEPGLRGQRAGPMGTGSPGSDRGGHAEC
jgi:hypothetical protein